MKRLGEGKGGLGGGEGWVLACLDSTAETLLAHEEVTRLQAGDRPEP